MMSDYRYIVKYPYIRLMNSPFNWLSPYLYLNFSVDNIIISSKMYVAHKLVVHVRRRYVPLADLSTKNEVGPT